ncbi:MAG: polyprenyl synthetase family protein [Deltaproteobacteria bacterium]|nr:polyprenyl synthetase family protein [Deltaproteobacteria bacterium]
MNLKEYLAEKKELIDRELQSYLPPAEGLYGKVAEAMSYSLMAGGKRLRPILCLAGAEAAGISTDNLLPVACSLEMIHTYSLIHDDLPDMDDDDYRRGRPTCHKVFGNAVAILAGDALLTEAFFLLTHEAYTQQLDPLRLRRVINIISEAAGIRGMIGGQVADVEAEGKEVDLPIVNYIHTHKTGALITASVTAGALAGGADVYTVTCLRRYGRRIGLAFQIADDILDLVGSAKELGKNTGMDVARQKATYPAVVGMKAARDAGHNLVKEALGFLESFGDRAEPLRAVATYIMDRTS